MNKLVCVVAVLFLVAFVEQTNADCYKDWSRCTPATSSWTGILWKSCRDYCRKCKGRAGGACQKITGGGFCSGGYQCQCSGGNVDKSGNWLVKITCALGL